MARAVDYRSKSDCRCCKEDADKMAAVMVSRKSVASIGVSAKSVIEALKQIRLAASASVLDCDNKVVDSMNCAALMMSVDDVIREYEDGKICGAGETVVVCKIMSLLVECITSNSYVIDAEYSTSAGMINAMNGSDGRLEGTD